jgi:tRNA A37 methylthiotransferase MiaB
MRTKSTKKNKINVITLGCSKNVYDSEVLMGQLAANKMEVEHESEKDDANIVVINTCGFIDNAKEESINTILEQAERKEAGSIDKLYVTGCLSERYKPDLEREITNVDQYFGTTDLPKLLKVLGADYKHELLGERLTTTPKHYAFPTGFPQDVLDVIRDNDKLCNYIDIPLQHINDEILKSMKRGTSHKKTNDLLKAFREKVPNMAIRTSLIVGYPGETEEIFQELKQWVQDTKFDRLGVFTYSHEENTSAHVLEDDISDEVKKARQEEIMDLQTHISWRLNQKKIGKTFKVLFDRKEGDYFIGRTEFDSPDVDNEVLVKANDTYIRMGDFANIKIEKTDHFDLYGVVVE